MTRSAARAARWIMLSVLASLLVGIPAATPANAATMSVDQFVAAYSGRAWDFDGAYGAQCTDLFNFYHRDVVDGPGYVRMPASGGAKDLWEATPASVNERYIKVSASAPAQKGDVAVWGGSKPNGTAGVCRNSASGNGCGHVSIVLSDLGNGKLRTFTQNPGPAQQFDDSKAHLLGYLRPKRFAAKNDPFGSPFDTAKSPSNGKIQVGGWAIDPDAKSTPIEVHVYVGGPAGTPGAKGVAVMANQSRPDVGRAYPGAGDNHGYSTTIDMGRGGNFPVYVYGINAPGTPGGNTLLGSRTISVGEPRPMGAFDSVTSPEPGKIRMRGWAFDPDAKTTPIRVHAYVGGRSGDPAAESFDLGPASNSRPDVAKVHGVGHKHGFDVTISVRRFGNVPVHLYAINHPGTSGSNIEFGNRSVSIRNPDPFGYLDRAEAPLGGRVDVRGWAIDPNAPNDPVTIHVSVGGPKGSAGSELHVLTANRSRPDVGKAHPNTGENHGFASSLLTKKRGSTAVYAYAVNQGPGRDVLLSQSTVTVADPLPLRSVKRPEIQGTAKRGATLRATKGGWSPSSDLSFSYQWKANGKPITGATKPSLKVSKALRGKKLSVTVSASRPGYVSKSVTSAGTAKVR